MGFGRAVSHGAAVCKPKLLGKVDVATNNSGVWPHKAPLRRFGLDWNILGASVIGFLLQARRNTS